MLAKIQGESFEKRRIELPPALGQNRLDGLGRAEDDGVCHPHEAPSPVGLDHRRIEQRGLRHPSQPGPWAFGLAAPEVHPLAIVRHERSERVPQPVRQTQRGAVWSQYLGDLMKEPLRQSQGALPHVNGQAELQTGSIATHTQGGERARRSIASASLTSPSWTALSKANSSSLCPGSAACRSRL